MINFNFQSKSWRFIIVGFLLLACLVCKGIDLTGNGETDIEIQGSDIYILSEHKKCINGFVKKGMTHDRALPFCQRYEGR